MRLRKNYCWVIVLCAALLVFCCQGLTANCISIYLSNMREAWGYTNSQISLFTTVRNLFSLLGVWIMGRFYRRVSLRAGLSFWSFMSAAAYWLGAWADRPAVFYTMAALLGLNFSLAGFAAASMMVRRWFKNRLGLAVGIFSSATGVATVLVPSLITRLIQERGLRFACGAEGTFIALVSLTVLLLARSQPADMGLEPYTGGGERSRRKHCLTRCPVPLSGREWIFVCACFFLQGLGVGPALSNLSLHFANCGFAAMDAAAAISMYGLCIWVGKLIFGYTVDRFGGKAASSVFLTVLGEALAGICLLKPFPLRPLLLGATGLMGFGYTVMSVGCSIWAADLNTPENYDETVRRLQLPQMIGRVVGSLIPGVLADRFDSYVPAYAISLVSALLFLLCLRGIYRRKTTVVPA